MRCLDENTVLDLLSGGLPEPIAADLDAHILECAACRELVVEALAVRDASAASPVGSSQWLDAVGLRESVPPDPGLFVAGAVLDGRYRLDQKIGEGGMGLVWAATELATGSHVAVKQIKGLDQERAARAVREAGLANAVQHAGVVKVRDVVDGGFITLPGSAERARLDGPLLVMELLEGESLAQRLSRQGRLSVAEASVIGGQIVDALIAVHAAGVVHRDLKPANVFLRAGPTTRIKLLDFGLAKRLRFSDRVDASSRSASVHLTRTGAMIGTPHYMAPEQIFGEDSVDASADAWALGVILHECLAGRRPIGGDTFGRILKEITMGSPPPLESEAGVPRDLARLIRGLMSKDPSARPPLVAAKRVLGEYAHGTARRARPSWLRKRAVPIGVVSGLTFAAVGLALAGARGNAEAPIVTNAPTAPVGFHIPLAARLDRTPLELSSEPIRAGSARVPDDLDFNRDWSSPEQTFDGSVPRRAPPSAAPAAPGPLPSASGSKKKLPGGLEPMPPY